MKTLIASTVLLAALTAATLPNTSHAQQAPKQKYSVVVSSNNNYFDELHLQSYVEIMNYMRDFVTPEEYAKIYLPIKTASAKAIISLRAHGPLSSTTHAAFTKLVQKIDQAGPALDALLSIEAHYQTAIDLLTLQEQLKDQLD